MEQVAANGLYLGAQYALIALGLTLIFALMNVLNFAHGQMYVLGGFITSKIFLSGLRSKSSPLPATEPQSGSTAFFARGYTNTLTVTFLVPTAASMRMVLSSFTAGIHIVRTVVGESSKST